MSDSGKSFVSTQDLAAKSPAKEKIMVPAMLLSTSL